MTAITTMQLEVVAVEAETRKTVLIFISRTDFMVCCHKVKACVLCTAGGMKFCSEVNVFLTSHTLVLFLVQLTCSALCEKNTFAIILTASPSLLA